MNKHKPCPRCKDSGMNSRAHCSSPTCPWRNCHGKMPNGETCGHTYDQYAHTMTTRGDGQ